MNRRVYDNRQQGMEFNAYPYNSNTGMEFQDYHHQNSMEFQDFGYQVSTQVVPPVQQGNMEFPQNFNNDMEFPMIINRGVQTQDKSWAMPMFIGVLLGLISFVYYS